MDVRLASHSVWAAIKSRRWLIWALVVLAVAGAVSSYVLSRPVVFVCQDLKTKLPVFFEIKQPSLFSEPVTFDVSAHDSNGDVYGYWFLAKYSRFSSEHLIGDTRTGRVSLNLLTGSFTIEALIEGKKPDTY